MPIAENAGAAASNVVSSSEYLPGLVSLSWNGSIPGVVWRWSAAGASRLTLATIASVAAFARATSASVAARAFATSPPLGSDTTFPRGRAADAGFFAGFALACFAFAFADIFFAAAFVACFAGFAFVFGFAFALVFAFAFAFAIPRILLPPVIPCRPMYLGIVPGTVVAERKATALEGTTLLLVLPVDDKGAATGDVQVAVDTVQAGVGDLVYLVGSREAALALDPWFVPVDAAIVGIVDGVDTP